MNDYNTLNSRLLKNVSDVSDFYDATLITSRNNIRESINNIRVTDKGITSDRGIYICKSIDSVKSKNGKRRILTSIESNYLFNDSTESDCKGLPSVIKFVENVKYTLTCNVNTAMGLVNGAEVYVVALCVNETTGFSSFSPHEYNLNSQPDFIVVKLVSNTHGTVQFDNLNENEIPIKPEKRYFYLSKKSKNVNIQRIQFPLSLCYAQTVFKAQGKTIPRIIVDLSLPPLGSLPTHYAYVALSRAQCLNNVLILRPFPIEVLQHKPNEHLISEMIRLEALAKKSYLKLQQPKLII